MNKLKHKINNNLDISRYNLLFVRLRCARRCASKSDKINHLMWVELNARLAHQWLVVDLRSF